MFSHVTRWHMIALGALASMAPIGPAAADEPEPRTVTLRGTELEVWPAEDLISRGFAIQRVPREENAAWLYIEAANTYPDVPEELVDAFQYAVGKGWPSGVAALDDYFAREDTRKAIELAMRASGIERCQMPYFGDPDGSVIGVLLPNLTHMRQLSKMMTADGRRLEAQGRIDEAIDRHLGTMRLGAHAAEGFTLIEGLVGVAVWTLGNGALRDLALRPDMTAAQLDRIARELDRLAPRVPTAERGLEGEQRFGPAVVDEVASRPFNLLRIDYYTAASGPEDLLIGSINNTRPKDGWGRLERRIGTLLFPDRTIKGHMAEFYKHQKTLARTPMSDTARSFNEENFITRELPQWDVLSRAMLPSLSRAVHLGLACRARFNIARTAVALRQHALAHEGVHPESLEELGKRMPAELMTDPMTGEPLRYRRSDAGWVLYGLGPNMKDDGGLEDAEHRWDAYDIALTYPLPIVEPFAATVSESN